MIIIKLLKSFSVTLLQLYIFHYSRIRNRIKTDNWDMYPAPDLCLDGPGSVCNTGACKLYA
jgi:hypothetical protein